MSELWEKLECRSEKLALEAVKILSGFFNWMHLLARTSSKRSSNWGDEEKVSNVEDEFKKEKDEEEKKNPLTPLKLTQKLGYGEFTGDPSEKTRLRLNALSLQSRGSAEGDSGHFR